MVVVLDHLSYILYYNFHRFFFQLLFFVILLHQFLVLILTGVVLWQEGLAIVHKRNIINVKVRVVAVEDLYYVIEVAPLVLDDVLYGFLIKKKLIICLIHH